MYFIVYFKHKHNSIHAFVLFTGGYKSCFKKEVEEIWGKLDLANCDRIVHVVEVETVCEWVDLAIGDRILDVVVIPPDSAVTWECMTHGLGVMMQIWKVSKEVWARPSELAGAI